MDAKIWKEIKVNEGSTVWSDRRKQGEKLTRFNAYAGMPPRGTKLGNWINNQMKSGPKGLDANIWKEIKENEGSTVWSDRKTTRVDSISRKNANKNA